MHTHSKIAYKQQCGFTLTELMVSLAIGLFILTGLISALVVSNNLNRMSTDMAHIADNVRSTNQLFSSEIMQGAFDTSCASATLKSLQTAIHFPVPVNSLFTPTPGITGYEFVGAGSPATSPNPIDIRNAVATAITANMWRNNLPVELMTLTDAAGNNIRPSFGSDILVVRYYQPITGITLNTAVPNTNTITFAPPLAGLQNSVIALENCSDTLDQPRDIFINASTQNNQWQRSNTALPWANSAGFSDATQRYQYIVRAFFIANDPVSRNNILYRYDFNAPNPIPILEGVENMQLRFRAFGNGFVNANVNTAWTNVDAVELSMLYQTLNADSAKYNAADQPNTIQMGGAQNVVVNTNDGRYRKAVSQIVVIRNKTFAFPGQDRFN